MPCRSARRCARTAAQAAEETHGAPWPVFPWFNVVFGRGHQGLRRYLRHPDPQERPQPSSSWRYRGPCRLCSAGGFPPGSCPRRTRATSMSELALPDAPPSSARDEACRKVEEILKKTPGVKTLHDGRRLQPAEHVVQNTYSGFFFVTLKEWKERTKAGGEVRAPSWPTLNRELAQDAGGSAFAFSPPAIQGIGTAGGATFVLEDRAGKDISLPSENVNKFIEAASKRRSSPGSCDDFPAHGSPDFRQGGPGQGAQAGRRPRPGLPDAPGLHGRILRQLLQPLRPPVAGLRGGGGRIPHQRRQAGTVLRAQTTKGTGAAFGGDHGGVAPGARVHDALQPLPVGADQRDRQHRATARAR